MDQRDQRLQYHGPAGPCWRSEDSNSQRGQRLCNLPLIQPSCLLGLFGFKNARKGMERARKRITKYQAFRIAGNQILSLFVYSRCPPVTSRSKSTAKGEAKIGARRLLQETDLPSLNQEQHFFFLWQGISSSLHITTTCYNYNPAIYEGQHEIF